MYDKDAWKREVGHITVDCSSSTSRGTRCKRFQWFPLDKMPAIWLCHDHKEA